MNSKKNESTKGMFDNKVIHYALQLLALSLLIYFCFEIIKPFIHLLIWGSVIAITLFPLHNRLTRMLKGRRWISASIITTIMFLFIIGPATLLTLATVDEFKIVKEVYDKGLLHIPPPNENVKNWPLIGSYLFDFWTELSANLMGFLTKHSNILKPVGIKVLELLSNAGMGILLLMGSFLVGGAMLVYGEQGSHMASQFFSRLAGKHGEVMESSVAVTVRNVAKGVIGVAFIQGLLAGIGLVLAGVPLAGLWALLGMVLCIIQIGIMPVSIGVVIYIWTMGDTTTAILLTIWMLFIGIVDNIIKPIMMGVGAPAPMLVVFMGTIGGFILNGFIGLFTGAIILTIGYQLAMVWLQAKPKAKSND
jgi:predicted PurR-regulated permease PerM